MRRFAIWFLTLSIIALYFLGWKTYLIILLVSGMLTVIYCLFSISQHIDDDALIDEYYNEPIEEVADDIDWDAVNP